MRADVHRVVVFQLQSTMENIIVAIMRYALLPSLKITSVQLISTHRLRQTDFDGPAGTAPGELGGRRLVSLHGFILY